MIKKSLASLLGNDWYSKIYELFPKCPNYTNYPDSALFYLKVQHYCKQFKKN